MKARNPIGVLCCLLLLAGATACSKSNGDTVFPTSQTDDTAPVTMAEPPGGTYGSEISVTLTPDEEATVYYTTDDSAPSYGNYTGMGSGPLSGIAISADTVLKFRAVDAAGNEESVKTQTYIIGGDSDVTAPTTTADPSGGTYDSPVSVSLTCDEPSAIYYTTDGDTPDTDSLLYSTPIDIATDTTLQFFAVDTAGNEEAVKSQEYVITGGRGGDGDAPVIDSVTPDSGPYGSEITIRGGNFGTGGTVVFFDGIEAKVISWSNNEIVCIVPAYSEAGEIAVTGSAGESNPFYFNVDNGSHGTGGEMGNSTRQYWGCKWKKVGWYDYYIGVHKYIEENPEEPAPLMVFANTHQNVGEMLFGAVVGKEYLSGTMKDRYPPDYDYPGIILYWSTETECDQNQFGEICGLVEEMKGLYNIDTSRIYMHATCNKSGYFIGWVVYRPDVFWGYSTDSTYGPGGPFGDLDSRDNSPEDWPATNKRMPCIFETTPSYAGGAAWAGRLNQNGWVAWNGTYEMTGIDYKKTWITWVNQDPYKEGDTYAFPNARDGTEPAQHPGVWEWHLRHCNPSPGRLTRP